MVRSQGFAKKYPAIAPPIPSVEIIPATNRMAFGNPFVHGANERNRFENFFQLISTEASSSSLVRVVPCPDDQEVYPHRRRQASTGWGLGNSVSKPRGETR
jgi:hypothetical protein